VHARELWHGRAWRDPILLGIIAGGGLLRVLAAAGHSAHVSADQRAYTQLASAIADHGRYAAHGLSGSFHWPPGAPVLFAIAERVGLSPYVSQVVVATLLIPAAALVAGLAGGRRAALIAAVVVALYPPLFNSPGELLSEPLGALLLALGIGAAGLGLRRGRAVALLPCGALLGLAVLTRADMLLVPLLVAAVVFAYASRREGARHGVASAGALLAAAACAVLPWIAFVATQKHQLVPVSTGGGSNLFIGTYLPGHGTIFGLKHAFGPTMRARVPSLRGEPDFRIPEQAILSYVARGHRGHADSYLRSRGLVNAAHYATTRPADFAGMLASKAGRLWLDYTHGSLRRSGTLARAGHLALVAAALAGLVVALRRRASPELVTTAGLLILATVLNALLVSEPRHLLPLLPLLFAGGAVGAAGLRRRRA
jgi:hypothetical protein